MAELSKISSKGLTLTAENKKVVGDASMEPIASSSMAQPNGKRTNGQTALEKMGFTQRRKMIAYNQSNDGYSNTEGSSYSPMHKNAISSPNKVKGKGTNSGGHTHFQGNYDTPSETPNKINYSNFLTSSKSSTSIGGKIDIDSRYEQSLMRRYNEDINEYSDKNEDAFSNGKVIGKGTMLYLDTKRGGGAYDVMARESSLMLNEWKNDLQYTKALVDSEYEVQTEFKVSSFEDDVRENAQLAKEKEWQRAWDDYKKQENRTAKAIEKAQKRSDEYVNNKNKEKPKETLPNVDTSNKTVVTTISDNNGYDWWIQNANRYGYTPSSIESPYRDYSLDEYDYAFGYG